jgi:hypothetical protein
MNSINTVSYNCLLPTAHHYTCTVYMRVCTGVFGRKNASTFFSTFYEDCFQSKLWKFSITIPILLQVQLYYTILYIDRILCIYDRIQCRQRDRETERHADIERNMP